MEFGNVEAGWDDCGGRSDLCVVVKRGVHADGQHTVAEHPDRAQRPGVLHFGRLFSPCLLYTSDAADDLLCVDLGGRRILHKKNRNTDIKHT